MTGYIGIDIWDEAEPSNHLPDPDADSTDNAVFVGQQVTGNTLIIGREEDEEWISTKDIRPLSVEEYR